MHHTPSISVLRLVNLRAVPAQPTPRRHHTPLPAAPRPARLGPASRSVAAENHSAARLSSDDARHIFAARVAESLQGGRAAVLPPHTRRNLLTLASVVGLRPFDANLLIAIVQDAARTGRSPLDADTARQLAFVRPADQPDACDVAALHPAATPLAPRAHRFLSHDAPSSILFRLAIALALGGLVAATLAAWILTG